MIASDPMRRRLDGSRAVWIAAMLMLPGAANAQTAQPAPLEIFGGYSYLRAPGNSVLEETAGDDVYALGWFAGAAHRVWRRVDLVGEAGGQYKSGVTLEEDASFSLHSLLGGARASIERGPTVLFAQALAGATHAHASAFGTTAGSTAFTLQGGGGVDYGFTPHLAARVQVDYRLIPAFGGLDATHQVRVAAGLVYR